MGDHGWCRLTRFATDEDDPQTPWPIFFWRRIVAMHLFKVKE